MLEKLKFLQHFPIHPITITTTKGRLREILDLIFLDQLVGAANVFGKPKKDTDYIPYAGEGFKLSIPSKWNPSKEREFPGQVLRYEDNFDATSNVSVLVQDTSKKSISEFGSPEEFLSQVTILFDLL